MLPIEEQLLTASAKRSWCAYVAARLAACQAALEAWLQRSKHADNVFSVERIQHELAYDTRQVERWHQSLDTLR